MHFSLSFAFLLIISLHKSFAYKFQINPPSEIEDLAFASSIIIDSVYLQKSSTLSLVKSINNENLQKFSDFYENFINSFKFDFTLKLEDAKTVKPLGNHPRRSNVFIIDSLKSFESILNILNHSNFKMRKLFIVISINPMSIDEITNIFKEFHRLLIININLISYDEHNNNISLFTFFPYRSEFECDNTTAIKMNSFDKQSRKWDSEKFHYLKSNDLKMCPLRIGAAGVAAEPAVMLRNNSKGKVELLGIEKDIFVELARRLNFTGNYKIHMGSVGSIYDNGSSTGVLGMVMRNEADAAIGFVTLQLLRTLFLSETTYYSMHSLAMIIPNGEEYGDIEKLLLPFSCAAWIPQIIIFFAATILSQIFLKFPKIYNFVIGRDVKYPVLTIIGIHLGVSQPKLPSRNFSRFILINFLFYCLVMRSSYQGSVFNILMLNDHKPPVGSINEMMEKGFKFYIYESLSSRLQDFAFFKNHKTFPNSEIDKYRRRTLNTNFKGVVFNYENQIHYLNQLNYKNFTYTICKEHFLTPSFVFYFRKNHFIVEEVNIYLERFLENGLIDHITSEYADKRFLKYKPDGGGGSPKALQIKHLYGAIEIYFLCSCISIVIFIMELVVTKLKFFMFKKTIVDNK